MHTMCIFISAMTTEKTVCIQNAWQQAIIWYSEEKAKATAVEHSEKIKSEKIKITKFNRKKWINKIA